MTTTLPPPASPDADADARAARRTLLLFIGALIVVLLGSALLVYAQRRHDDRASTTAAASATSGGEVTDLGPVKGTPVPAYLARRGAALSGASGDRIAVVSFTRYATDAEARKAVGDADVIRVLVAAPAGEPEVVSDDLAKWVVERRKTAAEQRSEVQRLLDSGTVDDPDFLAFYRSEVQRLSRLESSLDPKSAVVFGLVIKAPADGLQALSRAPGIRLVDVGASDDAAEGVRYRGLRPEETATAGEPPTRP